MRACSDVDMEGGPLIWRHLTGLEFYFAHLQPVDVFQQMRWTLHIHFDIFLLHGENVQMSKSVFKCNLLLMVTVPFFRHVVV